MRILFSLLHAGYLRHFEAVLEDLLQEGHSVCFAFHSEKEDIEKWTERLRTRFPQRVSHVTAPRRADSWAKFARRARGMRNYLMYLDDSYHGMDRLRENAARELNPADCNLIDRIAVLPGAKRLFGWLFELVELGIPSDKAIDEFVSACAPDMVLVSPLVTFNSPQVDYVKSARRLGIPSGLCVASWDNLTNKGQMRELPDRVFLWNESQAAEAMKIHGVPPDRIVVTGAQSFDHWFSCRPSRNKHDLYKECGLIPGTKLILYICSSSSIAPNEIGFIQEWYYHIRKSSFTHVSGAAILLRPHPMNEQPWEEITSLRPGNLAVWPLKPGGPYDIQWRHDYFDSLFHADAVVGLNTSAQVEAGLVGTPVLTVLSPECPQSLHGTMDTLHFMHLLQVNGGLLHVGRSFDEHIGHLAAALSGDAAMIERSRHFTEAFIRPFGIDQPATPILANAIRSLGSMKVGRGFLGRGLLQKSFTPMVRWALGRESSKRRPKANKRVG